MQQWQPLNLAEICPANINATACTSFGYIYLNLLVRLYGDSKDRRIQEQIKKEDEYDRVIKDCVKQRERDEYDFIVVGAGAAGCIVANRLSGNKHWKLPLMITEKEGAMDYILTLSMVLPYEKVLLLEAGIEQPDITLVPALGTDMKGSNIDWGYKTVPDGRTCLARPGGQCDNSRGKVMGGCTSVNAMLYIRGNKHDYDDWAAMGNPGWSYNEVLPYFKKSENNLNIKYFGTKYHGAHGEQPVSFYPYEDEPSSMIVDAFHELGLPIADYNGDNQEATMNAQTFSLNGERVSTNNAFIQPIRYTRKNLVVKIQSEVFKILINKRKVAYGVKYKRNGIINTAYAKKEVIVCGGPINSPKLLMLSGIGPKKHLQELNIKVIQNLPVGENLHEHVTFNGITIALNKSSTLIDQKTILEKVKEYQGLKLKHGPLSASGPLNALAFYKSDPHLEIPDIQVQMHCVYLDEYIRNIRSVDESLFIFPKSFYDGLIARAIYLSPKSRGWLLLNTTNPHGPPLVYPNYLHDPSDLKALIKGFRYLEKLGNTNAFKSRGAHFIKTSLEPCTQFPFDSDEYITCMAYAYTSTTYHHVGTCKMGPKWDKSAVVDSELRVYGIFGLRVVDSSIMPRVPSGNTQAPSMMIGEKGVDCIIKDWMK